MESSEVSLDHTSILTRLQELKNIHTIQTQRLYQQQKIVPYEECSNLAKNEIPCDDFQLCLELNDSEHKRSINKLINSNRITEKDLIDGVSLLSRNILSPLKSSKHVNSYDSESCSNESSYFFHNTNMKAECKSKIVLKDVPSLQAVVASDGDVQKSNELNQLNGTSSKTVNKRAFLKRGVGMTRFNMTSSDIGLVKNRKMPWLRTKTFKSSNHTRKVKSSLEEIVKKPDGANQHIQKLSNGIVPKETIANLIPSGVVNSTVSLESLSTQFDVKHRMVHTVIETPRKQENYHTKSPHIKNTWAKMLTQEQDLYLRQLKQSAYYRNYGDSPKKEVTASCPLDSPNRTSDSIISYRETVDQRLFDLLEQKLMNSSFTSNSSFLFRVIGNNDSGESTPKTMHRLIRSHPECLKLHPDPDIVPDGLVSTDNECLAIDNGDVNKIYDVEGHNILNVEAQGIVDDDSSTSYTETEETCRYICKDKNSSTCERDKEYSDRAKEHCECASEIISHDATQDTQAQETDDNEEMYARKDNDIFVTSELLKEKLYELEDEMNNFRKEYAQLAIEKDNFETQKQQFILQKADFEKKFYEEKVLTEYDIAELKESLAKKKLLYEQQMKDAKIKSAKKDKEEIAKLKKEIERIEQDLKNKVVQSGAVIARLRKQVKTLEKENAELKNINEKLSIENKRLRQSNVKTRRLTNIKTLAEINKSLSKTLQEVDSELFQENKEVQDTLHPVLHKNSLGAKGFSNLRPSVGHFKTKSAPNLSAQSQYAKYFSLKDQELKNNLFDSCGENAIDAIDCNYNDFNGDLYYPDLISKNTTTNFDKSSTNFYNETGLDREASPTDQYSEDTDTSSRSSNINEIFSRFDQSNNKLNNKAIEKRPECVTSNEGLYGKNGDFSRRERESTSSFGSKLLCNERLKDDGSKIVEYANGNIKIVSPDSSHIKFYYYNGDVKETFVDDGMVKYYYAQTKTYHTTYKDGLQVLQFPDGQLERRHADGSSEVHLANGSVRYVPAQNTGNLKEEWKFPDGTAVAINHDGEQVIRFPNGQIEVHNTEHKRREFPDGTVKLVYLDGTTETRFSSGRVRVKDKNGKLIIDSGSSDSVSSENIATKIV